MEGLLSENMMNLFQTINSKIKELSNDPNSKEN